jgi:hypothetical protein
VAFSSLNISCGEVSSACAADCPGVTALESKVAALETMMTQLQTTSTQQQLKIDELTGQLTQALAIEELACTSGQVMQWDGANWTCATPAKKPWVATMARTGTNLTFTRPGAAATTINIGDGNGAVTGTHAAYRPGGSGDAVLYFNLEGAPSFACTLLHD